MLRLDIISIIIIIIIINTMSCSITEVLPGDIVFLTSDGISDNFDPVVARAPLLLLTICQCDIHLPPPGREVLRAPQAGAGWKHGGQGGPHAGQGEQVTGNICAN